MSRLLCQSRRRNSPRIAESPSLRRPKLLRKKNLRKRSIKRSKNKPKREYYDLRVSGPKDDDCPPLWLGKQKYVKNYPIYKFEVSKSERSVDDSKRNVREQWQTIKLNCSTDYDLAEKLLSGKNNKREWLYEYISLMETKSDQNSFQSLTNNRNIVQIYEQFNWFVWAVGYFYFQNKFEKNPFGLPPHNNDAWIEGFMWKGVYFRLVPLEQTYLLKREMEAIKHISIELDECFALEENYAHRFDIDTSESYHRKVFPPLISVSEFGSYAIYGSPTIPIKKSGSSKPDVSIKNLQEKLDLDLSESMLQLMPYLSKLTQSNFIPLNMENMEEKFLLINCHSVLTPYLPDQYSKCIIRIPQELTEEISIYPFPQNGSIPLEELVSLFTEARPDALDAFSPEEAKAELKSIREFDFTAHGCKMKILLYGDGDEENDRAKAVFLARDERVYRLAGIKNRPEMIKFITNDIFSSLIIGEPEIISGDVLLVVELCENDFRLPYSLCYNKPVKKPEIYIETSISRAKEVLEASNDICSDLALLEFIKRKGLPESTVWIFSIQVRTKLIKQICKCILLANAIKRLVDKEVYVMSNIEGSDKLPSGIYREEPDDKQNSEIFLNSIIYIVESIMTKSFEKEPRLTKNMLMTLFFYRLESLMFHNSLQLEIEVKDYLQGKSILNDILQVATENPALFIKTLQNTVNISFPFELLRKFSIDKYIPLHSKTPLRVEEEAETPILARLNSYSPVSVRERIYFVMARAISTKEYVDLNEETPSRNSPDSSSVKNSYLDENSESEKSDSDNASESESPAEDSNEEYDSVDSLKQKENSPPFKQAKFERGDQKNLINSKYSSRMSMISNTDNVLRASNPVVNMSKNYIESNDNYKKMQYITKKVFLHLPSSLYRLKLRVMELESYDGSMATVNTEQVKNADFLQEFSVLRQNYGLQNVDDLNKLIMYLESAFKDVFSIEGDESAFIEILLINSMVLFICGKFDDVFKNIAKIREILFNLHKCPLEIISMLQAFIGLLNEKENLLESEKEYLMAIIHYFAVIGDPRGRGAYSSNYLLAMTWKSSMVAHYFKKQIDAELCEELLDCVLNNLSQARTFQKTRSEINPTQGPSKKWTSMFGQGTVKNKFTKSTRTSPHKTVHKENDQKINIDDIDVELLSNFQNETGDPFDDLKYTLSENRFLFYHWGLYKDKVEDIEDYLKHGAGNQLDFFIFMLRCNPCMFMSGIKFTNTEIREFTLTDGGNNILSLKSTSSIVSGTHNMSASLSEYSHSSAADTPSAREQKRHKSIHHGAYQHIFNKDHFGLSRSESNGIVYVWGTDTQGQLGSANIANMKFTDSDSDFRRTYPRILIGLKDHIVKEVCCGNEHCLAVTVEGDIYAWGNNTYKQLGIGYNSPAVVNQPTKVYNIKDVVQISCGYEHSMALNDEGELYSWGHGEGGLLGHGELNDEATPKMIEEFEKKNKSIEKVICGGLHTLAITTDGDLYSWGRGEGGQLGLSQAKLESLERLDCGISVPVKIIKDKTIIDIAAGVAHSLALSDEGKVYGWGHSNYGQLGLGFSNETFEPGTGNAQSCVFEPTELTTLKDIKISRIYSGSTFSMFLSEDEELYACGINDLGQCGIDTAHEELKMFEKIKDKATQKFETSLDISTPKKLECFFRMEVKGVACGEDHAFAVMNSGEKNKKMIWAWGMYKQGQLGLGNVKKRTNPRLLQTLYNCNILPDKVSCGSANSMCVLGDPYVFANDESESESSSVANRSSFKGFDQECWNIVEHQDEENFQLKMAEYN